MSASLDRYLQEKFPGLQLEPPLFYNADVGIRSEIGDPNPLVSDQQYFEQVRHRSTQLFRGAHNNDDELYIVLILHLRPQVRPFKIKVFRNAVKNKKALKKLSCNSIEWADDEEDGWSAYRYVLECRTSDLKPANLLSSDYRIYIFNATRDTIFHFYDSRGLDIVSNATGPLQALYHTYNDWILDYDRERVDHVFHRYSFGI
ncbi:DUF3885 domain-containing protein [Paenibacillus agaridevorans]|uniref:DUF3885 domain-containing protein n=1 Tax=Paenibacillus agaridevorans TaxID=171404 RepID=UPI001BE3D398|nr:DUF3885 domain-containing protein [Paenibacillus agaridevorans]